MTRAIGMMGMGGLFLLISPKLRDSLMGGLASGIIGMDKYSPYSYVGLVALTLVALMFYVSRASAPR
jgi:hypothetical protein